MLGIVSISLCVIFVVVYFVLSRQHVKVLPKKCCTCPPCAVQENTYSVYGGFDQNAQHELLRIDEVSNDWNRCCW